MITIKVNTKEHQFLASISLQEILEQLQISTNGIAVAVNQNIITKSDWLTTTLNQNDAVLIIKATQGG
ncbi:sulfur carrier protein ThiS [Lutibacter agarilyticus]|uniref:Sulfur carrier protein ThiS n=1 Tax=Lutibacter agarilyticus TaxID=1109740 RepID=A0A238XEK5_9FLAO|nr:sulfur carrier protein ThiS [Lutibacter agarilyticus]SNR56913.1 sulfur carrier protein ThiS [Lutibacter agarilyticus]